MSDQAPLVRHTEFHSTSGCGCSGKDEIRAAKAKERTRRAYRRREGLWSVSTRSRQRACGRVPAVIRSGDGELTHAGVSVAYNEAEGYAFLRGMAHCGYNTCPVCGRKIAHARAEEIRVGVENALARGHGVYMLVLTLPHGPADSLPDLLRSAWAAWGKVNQGRNWRDDVEVYGIVGTIRSLEATFGPNGAHPHLHVLIVTEGLLDRQSRDGLSLRIYDRWARKIEGMGHGTANRRLFNLYPIATPQGIGRYLSKVTGDDSEGKKSKGENAEGIEPGKAAMELARGDLKQGKRRKHRTPLQVLDDALAMPDDPYGIASLALWSMWEQAVKGRQLIRWSGRGDGFLKRILNVADRTDDEILEEQEASTVQIDLDLADAEILFRNPHHIRTLLDSVERYGIDAVWDVLEWLTEREQEGDTYGVSFQQAGTGG